MVSGQVLVDFVQAAMNAMVDVVNSPMQPVVQVVKETGIPSGRGRVDIRHAAKAEKCGDQECGGVFHRLFFVNI
jgi:hypothetical protein